MSRHHRTHRDCIHFHEVPAPQQNTRHCSMGFNETPNAPPPSAYEIANAPNEKSDAAESLAVAAATTMGEPSSVVGGQINNRCEGNPQHYMEVCEMPPSESAPSTSKQLAMPHMAIPARPSGWRKRSVSYCGSGSEDNGGDDARISRLVPVKKHNHSEVEKRRRDKMNTYISELSCMIPMCGAMSRKLDKLTVLRMAAQHLRSVRGSISACRLGAQPRPAYLPETELNELVLDAARKCFVLVVGCDRGRLLYVSESVSQTLSYDKSELLGQSLFDILHPKDVAKVKEQLSSSDLSPRERFIDAKTMLPMKREVCAGTSRFCTGARRSFYCRIKCKTAPEPSTSGAPTAPSVDVKEEGYERPHTSAGLSTPPQPAKKYRSVLCTGYLKSWAPEVREGDGCDEGDYSTSCLVAVARALPDLAPMPVTTNSTPATRLVQFVSRHATDGKFLFVDQRVTPALGFLPQELLGTSLYEYVAAPEVSAVAFAHKEALLHRNPLHTSPYYFRQKNGSHARLQTQFKPFRNPWTKDVDYLVANNTVLSDTQQPQPSPDLDSYHVYKQMADAHVQYLIDSHKIVSTIAEEVPRPPSPDFPLDLPTDLLQDPFFTQQPSLIDSILNEPGLELVEETRGETRDETPGSAEGGEGVAAEAGSGALSGGGEVALAVIMSLLEVDAGLGGPINLSTFP